MPLIVHASPDKSPPQKLITDFFDALNHIAKARPNPDLPIHLIDISSKSYYKFKDVLDVEVKFLLDVNAKEQTGNKRINRKTFIPQPTLSQLHEIVDFGIETCALRETMSVQRARAVFTTMYKRYAKTKMLMKQAKAIVKKEPSSPNAKTTKAKSMKTKPMKATTVKKEPNN